VQQSPIRRRKPVAEPKARKNLDDVVADLSHRDLELFLRQEP
jgi:hypothetical protein